MTAEKHRWKEIRGLPCVRNCHITSQRKTSIEPREESRGAQTFFGASNPLAQHARLVAQSGDSSALHLVLRVGRDDGHLHTRLGVVGSLPSALSAVGLASPAFFFIKSSCHRR